MPENNTVEDCGVRISAYEERRLRELMRRSDALSTAYVLAEDGNIKPEARDEALEVLREMADDAANVLAAYRRELGLPEPGEQ
jgi:hypothetical protein